LQASQEKDNMREKKGKTEKMKRKEKEKGKKRYSQKFVKKSLQQVLFKEIK